MSDSGNTMIESELGSVSYKGAGRQVIDVEDTSAEATEMPNARPDARGSFESIEELEQMRQPRLTEKKVAEIEKRRREVYAQEEAVTPEMKKRVEFLAGIGRLTDTFEVDGVKFSIQTLKSKGFQSLASIVRVLSDLPPSDFIFELRKETLARAVSKINDVSLSNVVGSESIEKKVAFFHELDENLIAHINDKYQILIKSGGDKYGIKTEEDVKEVAEAVKKQ
jgi:hypothetical protein